MTKEGTMLHKPLKYEPRKPIENEGPLRRHWRHRFGTWTPYDREVRLAGYGYVVAEWASCLICGHIKARPITYVGFGHNR